MTTQQQQQQHPITPPPELVQRLCDKAFLIGVDGASRGDVEVWLIQEAFAAGADQELKACCVLMDEWGLDGEDLVECRRPKPPSLKEQAMKALDDAVYMADDIPPEGISTDQANIIRRALEQLDD